MSDSDQGEKCNAQWNSTVLVSVFASSFFFSLRVWGVGVGGGGGWGGEGLSKMQKNISSILTAFNWVDNQLYLYHINAFVKDAKKNNSYSYSLKLSWQPVLLTYINAFVKDAHKKTYLLFLQP